MTRRRFPPFWAVLATLLLAFACVGSLAGLFVALGGRATPGGLPRLVILTADLAAVEAVGAPPLLTATPAPGQTIAPPAAAAVNYVMLGPTLPPPAITTTPEQVAVGRVVTVIDVGDQQLNVRDVPGVMTSTVIFRSPEGSRFTVLEGPNLVDGLTWWRIQDVDDPARVGWAASNYLEVAASE